MVKSIQSNEPLELIYKGPIRRTVVQFPQGLIGKAVFGSQDYFLERAMEKVGIPIPIDERAFYPEFKNNPNLRAIFLRDASFGKAFYEIHFKRNMDLNHFAWNSLSKSNVDS